MTGIPTEFPDFCRELYIAPGASENMNLDALAPIFASRDGKYTFIIMTPLGERIATLSMSQPGAFRSFLTAVVYEPIYNLFVALLIFLPGHSLGWAILIITLIVRLILLVPQHHMLQSQKKLQMIQPKIKALQSQYKDDQAKLGMEMIELYKKE